jgi:ABC-type lipoprotein export system ATPase subunit
MDIVELKNYSLAPIGKGMGLCPFDFRLGEGDVCSVNCELVDDAHLFVRALATLENPTGGEYAFKGEKLDFSSYLNLLPYKRRISFISPDSVLIGNRTLRENLLMSRVYFEDRGDLELGGRALEMCRLFQIEARLDMRPWQLDNEDVRLAVIVRELSKDAELIILERPRDHLGYKVFGIFVDLLKTFIAARVPMVLVSADEELSQELSNMEAVIRNGAVFCNAPECSGRS